MSSLFGGRIFSLDIGRIFGIRPNAYSLHLCYPQHMKKYNEKHEITHIVTLKAHLKTFLDYGLS